MKKVLLIRSRQTALFVDISGPEPKRKTLSSSVVNFVRKQLNVNEKWTVSLTSPIIFSNSQFKAVLTATANMEQPRQINLIFSGFNSLSASVKSELLVENNVRYDDLIAQIEPKIKGLFRNCDPDKLIFSYTAGSLINANKTLTINATANDSLIAGENATVRLTITGYTLPSLEVNSKTLTKVNVGILGNTDVKEFKSINKNNLSSISDKLNQLFKANSISVDVDNWIKSYFTVSNINQLEFSAELATPSKTGDGSYDVVIKVVGQLSPSNLPSISITRLVTINFAFPANKISIVNNDDVKKIDPSLVGKYYLDAVVPTLLGHPIESSSTVPSQITKDYVQKVLGVSALGISEGYKIQSSSWKFDKTNSLLSLIFEIAFKDKPLGKLEIDFQNIGSLIVNPNFDVDNSDKNLFYSELSLQVFQPQYWYKLGKITNCSEKNLTWKIDWNSAKFSENNKILTVKVTIKDSVETVNNTTINIMGYQVPSFNPDLVKKSILFGSGAIDDNDFKDFSEIKPTVNDIKNYLNSPNGLQSPTDNGIKKWFTSVLLKKSSVAKGNMECKDVVQQSDNESDYEVTITFTYSNRKVAGSKPLVLSQNFTFSWMPLIKITQQDLQKEFAQATNVDTVYETLTDAKSSAKLFSYIISKLKAKYPTFTGFTGFTDISLISDTDYVDIDHLLPHPIFKEDKLLILPFKLTSAKKPNQKMYEVTEISSLPSLEIKDSTGNIQIKTTGTFEDLAKKIKITSGSKLLNCDLKQAFVNCNPDKLAFSLENDLKWSDSSQTALSVTLTVTDSTVKGESLKVPVLISGFTVGFVPKSVESTVKISDNPTFKNVSLSDIVAKLNDKDNGMNKKDSKFYRWALSLFNKETDITFKAEYVSTFKSNCVVQISASWTPSPGLPAVVVTTKVTFIA